MALLWIDSFDDRTSNANFIAKYDASSAVSLSSVGGRTGNAVQVGTSYGTPYFLTKNLNNIATVFVGIACLPSTATPSAISKILEGLDGATSQWYVAIDTAGDIGVYRGDGTNIANTTGGSKLSTTLYNYIELKITTDNSAAVYQVLLNGTSILSGSGVNLRNGTHNYITAFKIRSITQSGSTMKYDDYYICDDSGSSPWNTYLSGANPNTLPKIGCKVPSGAGNSTQWTPDTGSNYARVSESNPDGDTSYVADTTVGDIDLYALPSSGLTTNPILGVMTTLWTKLDAAGSRGICVEYRSGGTNYDGSTITETVTTGYTPHSEIKMLDPATSAQWTRSNLDALQVGIKVIS